MKQTAYLDQNVLSYLDRNDGKEFFDLLRDQGIQAVVSYHHLTEICLSSNPEKFIARLEKLNPFFLSREQSLELVENGTTQLSTMRPSYEISQHVQNASEFEKTFLHILFPLLKFSGGLSKIEEKELLNDYIASMRSNVKLALRDSNPLIQIILRMSFYPKLWKTIRAIRRSFRDVDFDEDAKRFRVLRDRVTALGNISQIPVEKVVETVLAQMDEMARLEFIFQYPRNFARGSTYRPSELFSFAFSLSAMGAIPRTGRMFRGEPEKQKDLFRAQFLDCLHIAEAGFFNAFTTCDNGAHRLAAAVYSYAGVNTKTIKLEFDKE